MLRNITSALALVLFGVVYPATAAMVEIALIDKHDEPRGYCFDIIGSQSKAKPEQGLQAHTCYSYQGIIAVDQGFDETKLAGGEFYLPSFGVCMSTASFAPGARLQLASCDGGPRQRFQLARNGRITPVGAADLCITAADGPGRPGGGGQPRHLIRALTLESCDQRLETMQRWRIRKLSE